MLFRAGPIGYLIILNWERGVQGGVFRLLASHRSFDILEFYHALFPHALPPHSALRWSLARQEKKDAVCHLGVLVDEDDDDDEEEEEEEEKDAVAAAHGDADEDDDGDDDDRDDE